MDNHFEMNQVPIPCSNCGKNNTHKAQFCANCGDHLITRQLEAREVSEEKDTQEVTICEICLRPAKTDYIIFEQNTGMLFMRQAKTFSGQMCKPCATKTFLKVQLHGLVLGWWGTISFFVNIFNILYNTINYARYVLANR